MRRLAWQINSANPALGQRHVIRQMDAGARFSQHFDMDLASLLPTADPIRVFPIERRTLTGAEA